jgi:lipase
MTFLHVHNFGTPGASPVLAIHGITAHGTRFAPLAAAALADRHVLAPDLRGHGFSPSEAPWNLETHVADLVEVLDSVGWEKIDVIGHSLGGNLGLRLLSAHPERVNRLLLLDPAFDLPSTDMTERAQAILTDTSYESLQDLVKARRAGRIDAAIPHSDDDSLLASVCGDDGRWRMRFDRAAVVAMWGEIARPLPIITSAVSTTLVNALEAGFVLEAQCAYLREQFGPNLTEIDVPLGHMVYWDDFAQTARIVSDWANQNNQLAS